jgi:hypothetical protein
VEHARSHSSRVSRAHCASVERESQRERKRESEIVRETEKVRQRERERESQRDKERVREREREREREAHLRQDLRPFACRGVVVRPLGVHVIPAPHKLINNGIPPEFREPVRLTVSLLLRTA